MPNSIGKNLKLKKSIEFDIILIERNKFEGLTGGYEKWDNIYRQTDRQTGRQTDRQSINLSNFQIKLNNNTLEDCLKAYCF